MNKHLYFRHLLVLSSPTLIMHGHMNLKFILKVVYQYNIFLYNNISVRVGNLKPMQL